MSTERFNVIFKDYPESVPLSLKQQPKYWKKKDKIGVRMQARINANEVDWMEIPKKSAKVKKGTWHYTIKRLANSY